MIVASLGAARDRGTTQSFFAPICGCGIFDVSFCSKTMFGFSLFLMYVSAMKQCVFFAYLDV